MRNLKKFLALVLAMVMAFSLMLSASAAEVRPSTNFSDDEAITEAFVEAVDVLTGMDVFQGDEEAPTMRPGSTITRAEVAALIYRLATGDTDDVRAGLYANYPVGGFYDVQESDWFAGYVGYCANAGYIKGTSSETFDPYAPVTGYETLAMILRVIGYDKNHEFEGTAWQTNVSALGTQLGILDDVKTTDYANTLHLASRRDVVASILFRAAAYVPMVTYTPMAGYYKYDSLLGTEENDTVGGKYFGLTYGRGIVVSNEGTGDTKTVWRVDEMKNNSKAVYYAVNDNNNPDFTDVPLKWDTGLKDFGHKYKVWYDCRPSVKTVYTAYDEVVKTQMVIVDDNDTPADSGELTAGGALATIVSQVGFVNPGEAYLSDSFNAFAGTEGSKFDWARANDVTDVDHQKVYLLISNTSTTLGDELDAVVSMNVESSQITQIDNISATKTIKLPATADKDTTNEADRFATPDTTLGASIAVADNSYIEIRQSALTANSSKTLGDYVVTIAIGIRNGGTDGDNRISKYNVSKIVDTKVGQVVSYNTSEYDAARAATVNKTPDYVMLADGTKLEKSVLYYTVQDDTIPQQGDSDDNQVADDSSSATDPDVYTNITYRFYLDSEGRYIGAEPVHDAEFIYGTYADYSQETSSSTFKYYMTGVTLDGEIVTREFKTFNGGGMTTNGLPGLDTNYHNFGVSDALGTGVGGHPVTVNGNTFNKYNGFMLNNAGGLYDDNAPAGGAQMTPAAYGIKKLTGHTTNVTVDKDSVEIGAELFVSNTVNGETSDLYLTETTKIIVVSGTGTETVKATVYNGITEFLGNSTTAVIGRTTAQNPRPTGTSPNKYDSDIYYTVDDSYYANVQGVYSHAVDTVFINAKDITRTGANGLYFTGAATPILTDAFNTNYNLYTLYKDGEAENVWLSSAPNQTTFYNTLTASGTTSTGETVYTLSGIETSGSTYLVRGNQNQAIGGNGSNARYIAATRNAQVATIAGTLYNVANAKMVNLIPEQLPNLNSIEDLNEVSSNMTGTPTLVYVYISLTEAGGNIVSTIYVTGVA